MDCDWDAGQAVRAAGVGCSVWRFGSCAASGFGVRLPATRGGRVAALPVSQDARASLPEVVLEVRWRVRLGRPRGTVALCSAAPPVGLPKTRFSAPLAASLPWATSPLRTTQQVYVIEPSADFIWAFVKVVKILFTYWVVCGRRDPGRRIPNASDPCRRDPNAGDPCRRIPFYRPEKRVGLAACRMPRAFVRTAYP